MIISGCYPKNLTFMVELQCRRNAEFRRNWEAKCRMLTAFQKPGILPCIGGGIPVSWDKEVQLVEGR